MFEHEDSQTDLLEQIEDLIQEKRYAQLRDLLVPMEAPDIAQLCADLDEKNTALVFRLLPKEQAAEVFVELDSDQQEMLIRGFFQHRAQRSAGRAVPDDTVDIVEEMPANVVKRILRHSDPETRKSINEILKYPDDSTGSIMTTEFVDLKATMTVEAALKRIRRTGPDKETINICYVIDDQRHLLGLLSIRTLLLAEDDDIIDDIMERHIISVHTLDDQESTARVLSKYDFLALPVVDTENRLVGIVTVDDAMDVLREEVTEDIELMAAILPGDKPYLKTGVLETRKARTPWLLVLMLSATFTGIILTHFENALAACAILTSFIPMLSGTGGNSGTRASTAVIRALSLGELRFSDLPGSFGRSSGSPSPAASAGSGQLRQDDGGGSLADAQSGGHAVGGAGGVYHPDRHRDVCQAGGLLAAAAGRKTSLRSGGHGIPLHLHDCGLAVPAHLFSLCLLVPGAVSRQTGRHLSAIW